MIGSGVDFNGICLLDVLFHSHYPEKTLGRLIYHQVSLQRSSAGGTIRSLFAGEN